MFGPSFRPGNWDIPQNFSVTGDLLDVQDTLCTVLDNVNATGKVCDFVAPSLILADFVYFGKLVWI